MRPGRFALLGVERMRLGNLLRSEPTVHSFEAAHDAPMVDLIAARMWLTAAVARHRRHMDGDEPTTEASQARLMDEMERALAALGPVMSMPEEMGEGDIGERAFTQDQRDAMAKSGAAMPDGSFPIATVADLRNAVQAYGRAADKAAAKRHIIKRARALNVTDELPEKWGVAAESDWEELTGDMVPLVEKAVRRDGTIAVKVIAPGQGASGFYPADVLERDGPTAFRAGLHMHLDHPSISEESDRPERSVTTLAGTLTSDARWEATGAAGPGLYADARLRSDLAPLIEELAPHIGVSIRALGRAGTRDIGGTKLRTIESIDRAKSVDFVTVAGAGGKVLDLVESARSRRPVNPAAGDDIMSQQELDEARTKIAEAERTIAALEQRIQAMEQREAEAKLLREAGVLITEALNGIGLPVPTRTRLQVRLALDPPLKDGALDKEALTSLVTEAAKTELAYLAEATGTSGQITGMGGMPSNGTPTPTLEESDKRITAALAGL